MTQPVDEPAHEGGPPPDADEAASPDPDTPEASGSGIGRPDVATLAPDDLETLATQTLDQLETVTAERDDYLDRLRRLQADFENYKKRSAKEHHQAGERATARLADQLLPVLDSCDAALLHGATAVEPVFAALLGTLEKAGLERVDPLDAPFDPSRHEAVMHEHGDEDQEGPVVVEVLRPGYAWKGAVIRPAMVKVKG